MLLLINAKIFSSPYHFPFESGLILKHNISNSIISLLYSDYSDVMLIYAYRLIIYVYCDMSKNIIKIVKKKSAKITRIHLNILFSITKIGKAHIMKSHVGEICHSLIHLDLERTETTL